MQTSVNQEPTHGFPGQLADLDGMRNSRVITRRQAEVSAAIPFGLFVKQGTDPENDALLPSAKTDILLGVACFANSYAIPYQLTAAGLQPGTHFGIVARGTVFVLPTENVVPGDHVHVRVTAGSGKVPGSVGNVDGGVATLDVTPFCRWEESGTAATPTKLWLDMSNAALTVTDS